MEAVEVT